MGCVLEKHDIPGDSAHAEHAALERDAGRIRNQITGQNYLKFVLTLFCCPGLNLYYLPAYRPEVDRIEPVFRQIKHQAMPVRSYKTKAELQEAVETAFRNHARDMGPQSKRKRRPAA